MRQFTIGLVQATNVYSDTCFFPYTVGALQAYFQKCGKNSERYEFLEPIYRMESVDLVARRLAETDMAAFSVYMWNVRFSLAVAERLKTLNPHVLIVFGGPEVPNNQEPFLLSNPFVDVACEGEGEFAFAAILERLEAREFSGIEGVAWRRGEDILSTPRNGYCKDLSELPSPYLEGVFDSLLNEDRGHRWDGIWETNRGCPYRCGYCYWGASPAKKILPFPMERVLAEVEWFAKNKVRFIYLADSNFGIMERDLDLVRELARSKAETGFPTFISSNFMKSPTDRALEICRILEDTKLSRGVTIGLQSTSSEALENIGRKNISANQLKQLQTRLNQENIATYVDMILGLPGETYDSFVDGIEEIIASRQANHVQFNNLVLIPNSRLSDPEAVERFALRTRELDSLNLHSTDFYAAEGLRERKQLVVETYSMDSEAWVRSRVYAWMAAFLYFDKMLQVPMVLLAQEHGLAFRDLMEPFMDSDLRDLPVLTRIRDFLFEFAQRIQDGGDEFCRIPELMDTYWTQDEFLMIHLSMNNLLEAFYRESQDLFTRVLKERGLDEPDYLYSAFRLNHALLKQPFQPDDLHIELDHDIWSAYQGFLNDEAVPVRSAPSGLLVRRSVDAWDDWEQWAKEVVWYEHRLGAYFHELVVLDKDAPVAHQVATKTSVKGTEHGS